MPSTADLIVSHVLQQLEIHKNSQDSERPLFVALQGPQGSGKTYLTKRLETSLTSHPHNLRVAVLSIDDLYLPHEGLVQVASNNPKNRLLQGRGQPGTHDVPLGHSILVQLKNINTGGMTDKITLPFFDKSLYNGQGDRSEDGSITVEGPLDLVILEGWCVGFHSLHLYDLEERFHSPIHGVEGVFDIHSVRKEDVLEINSALPAYHTNWWSFFDAFIQIKPPDSHPYSHIYKWRLEQEHNMKANNGGRGMTDEQVKLFVSTTLGHACPC
ncbi:P-loop containing nucleoside triphosphate hydrolase protein [Sistotremastrum suecicum HHB10207 ss-3]|uniref:p-loop containing nucleoside triphosphate hydrolase protein n=1 Tax=Sistotremastrum suecicum HHB10207 ss-3 TaxID=1314776 RepID=A0A166HYW3_9AGAM|nr:P-loop containing nucleoside triphosphate hydrolase protein [Sistotremastrum suecicum HHB10207 ss-3]